MKILAFGASINSKSINVRLARWASRQIAAAEVNFIDLNEYEMPIFSVDRQKALGIPEPAQRLKQFMREADGILISFAEHNGSYTAAFKNVFDWMSRLEKPIWLNKPMFLLATSPGKRGATGVLNDAIEKFPYQGAIIAGNFSLPLFNENFTDEGGIMDDELRNQFNRQLDQFQSAMNEVTVDGN